MRIAALVSTLALALAVVGATEAAARPPWTWSEAKASQQVIEHLKIPCRVVFPRQDDPHWLDGGPTCDLRSELNRLDHDRAIVLQCKQSGTCDRDCRFEPAPCSSGGPSAIEASLRVEQEVKDIRYIRQGFRIKSARCIGTGNPDASSYRFSRFRCDLILEGNIATARIAVWVTGRNHARAQLIP